MNFNFSFFFLPFVLINESIQTNNLDAFFHKTLNYYCHFLQAQKLRPVIQKNGFCLAANKS